MTTSTKPKRPTIRPGDLAYVVGAGFGEIPLYRIVSFDTDCDGNISTYYLADSANPSNKGGAVEAQRVTAVFSNVLNQE